MDTIHLVDISDRQFAMLAQGATVTDATLPSGLHVPSHGKWVIEGSEILNKDPEKNAPRQKQRNDDVNKTPLVESKYLHVSTQFPE